MANDTTIIPLVATGHNNTGSLAEFTQRPLQVGQQPPESVIGGTGRRIWLGQPRYTLRWGRIPYNLVRLLLADVGLDDSTPDALVTLAVADNDDRRNRTNYNAIVDYPPSWRFRQGGIDDLTLEFRDLEEI